MKYSNIVSYGDNIWALDVHEGHTSGRTSSYIIRGKKTVLIDTGSSICHPYLLQRLAEIEVDPREIDYVIATHIHLDHSGGVGKLLPVAPNAKVVVHPRGARHLIDPSHLLQGARAAWGERVNEIFGEVLPVPSDRILIREDGEQIDIGDGRQLTFLDTPGHARHHFSIWDPQTGGVFCGDTFGLRLIPEFTGWTFSIVYPSTSPSDFDPEAVSSSIEKIAALKPVYLYHAHFGRSNDPAAVFRRIGKQVFDFDRIGRDVYNAGLTWEAVIDALRHYIRKDLQAEGHSENLSLKGLEMDLDLNAKGIWHKVSREHA